MSPEGTATDKAPAHVARRRALMAYSVAVLLALLATFGKLDPGGYVVVRALFDHPYLFGVLTLALLGTAFWVGPGRFVLRATGLALAAVATLGYAVLGGLVFPWGSSHGPQVMSERAPGGKLEVRVTEGAAVIDPVWELSVRRRAGLLTREWSAGCLNGDDPKDEFVSVRWTGQESLAVTVADGRVLRVHLDAATGRPQQPAVTGVGC